MNSPICDSVQNPIIRTQNPDLIILPYLSGNILNTKNLVYKNYLPTLMYLQYSTGPQSQPNLQSVGQSFSSSVCRSLSGSVSPLCFRKRKCWLRFLGRRSFLPPWACSQFWHIFSQCASSLMSCIERVWIPTISARKGYCKFDLLEPIKIMLFEVRHLAHRETVKGGGKLWSGCKATPLLLNWAFIPTK